MGGGGGARLEGINGEDTVIMHAFQTHPEQQK